LAVGLKTARKLSVCFRRKRKQRAKKGNGSGILWKRNGNEIFQMETEEETGERFPKETETARKFRKNKYGNFPEI
jgi:hypothetical protein